MKNQFGIKNLPDPISTREAASKNYVANKFNNPSERKNIAHVDFNERNLDNVRFVKINSFANVREHLTPKIQVDEAISCRVDESALLRLDPDEKLKLDEQDSIFLNSTLTTPKTTIEVPTKSFVDILHEIIGNRQNLSSVYNDQDNEVDDKELNKLI